MEGIKKPGQIAIEKARDLLKRLSVFDVELNRNSFGFKMGDTEPDYYLFEDALELVADYLSCHERFTYDKITYFTNIYWSTLSYASFVDLPVHNNELFGKLVSNCCKIVEILDVNINTIKEGLSKYLR